MKPGAGKSAMVLPYRSLSLRTLRETRFSRRQGQRSCFQRPRLTQRPLSGRHGEWRLRKIASVPPSSGRAISSRRHAMDHTGVHDHVSSRNGPKPHDVVLDLHHNEREVLIKTGRGLRGAPIEIAAAKLARRTADEIRDAALRLEAFVHVIVAAEDHLHVVLDKQR